MYKLLCVKPEYSSFAFHILDFHLFSTGCFEFHGCRLQLSGPFVTRFTPQTFFLQKIKSYGKLIAVNRICQEIDKLKDP